MSTTIELTAHDIGDDHFMEAMSRLRSAVGQAGEATAGQGRQEFDRRRAMVFAVVAQTWQEQINVETFTA